ncbi:MAG: flagellar hook protein FlgE [Spirochaetes bacterium]|nr:flagellar hook protein FlgE [Spirochaetota bacterium]
MMPSLYSGVSGLKNHNVRMNVVGNNIANVNTYGFKYSRVSFQDLLYQTLSGAASPTEDKGGVNPKQSGLGMKVASIDKIFSEGSIQTTGKNTDLAIQGEGFFIVAKGDQKFYTRAGTFEVDKEGTLVNPASGMKVLGWEAQEDAQGNKYIDASSTIGQITIPLYGKTPAKATTETLLKSNLNTTTEIIRPDMTEAERIRNTVRTSIDVYDSEGEVHQLNLSFEKLAQNQWRATTELTGADGPITLDLAGAAAAPAGANNQMILNFDQLGSLNGVTDTAGTAVNQGLLTVSLKANIPGKNPLNISLNLGDAGQYNGITQFSSLSSTKFVAQNGYNMGYLESFEIDDSGVVTGSYSNGQKHSLAQVSLAVFTNPGGLNAVGETMFAESNNSGMAIIGEPDSGGRGKIQAGALEMSNVDLAEQFTDMIVTQRGFQANSRTITTSDQMIQELLTLKR